MPKAGKVTKRCEICNVEFMVNPSVDKRGGGRFCSRGCYAQWLSVTQIGENHPMWDGGGVEKVCEICKNTFLVPKSTDKRGGGKYCSRECTREAQKLIRGPDHPSWKPKVKCVCQICKKEFELHESSVLGGEGTCCSRKCHGEYRSKYLTGENAANYQNKTSTGQCVQCGKEITVRAWKVAEGRDKFCGKACYHQWFSQNVRGENHPNWLGGNGKYPQEWTFGIKKIIRNRDDHKCRLCGLDESQQSRNLDVHHIDYDKHNLSPDNLMALCRSCHAKTNFNREYWEGFLSKMMQNDAVLNEVANG